jgi:hypothetical protein
MGDRGSLLITQVGAVTAYNIDANGFEEVNGR